jgi:cobalt-precorrin-5B (C1)-methyltransferase
MARTPNRPLRRGWTTGACAAAAARAAYTALLTGKFPDPVTVALPRGHRPSFALARQELTDGAATAGIIKDAGDDPDVTHGALVLATVRRGRPGAGVTFKAGAGVGMVTRAGLPLAVGEPAINPAPRRIMAAAVAEIASQFGDGGDVEIEIAIPGGEKMAARTMNGRLGIEGGLSVLGTTGIVTPYSCAAWIASIHQGIDVARAAGLTHVAAATGKTSEAAVHKLYGLAEFALLDMGDFAGGLLKYLRDHPIDRISIAGGFAKITKLADGHMDLHSARSTVDVDRLAENCKDLGAVEETVSAVRAAPTALAALEAARQAGVALADAVAGRARRVAEEVLSGDIAVEVLIFDRAGHLVGRSGGDG